MRFFKIIKRKYIKQVFNVSDLLDFKQKNR